MNRKKIHILYEYGIDFRPHASSFIRLLRPLNHPVLREYLEVSSSMNYEGQDVDTVIIDRLWRPDISPDLAEQLVERIRRARVGLIYSVDDNLLDLPAERKDWPKEHHLMVFSFLLEQADGVLVATEALKKRLSGLNPNIRVVGNALDERLLMGGRLPELDSPFNSQRIVIGYMGTRTHDADLLMILPALRAVYKRYGDRIEFQLLGVTGQSDTDVEWSGLPGRLVGPPEEEDEYPLFMFWFTSRVRWDIAIAPLRETPFTRCKSDVKFLDYAAIGTTGIYSHGVPYGSSVRHEKTGLLVENNTAAWIEALERLLLDASLREHIACESSSYLYRERTLAQCARNWLVALDSLLEASSIG